MAELTANFRQNVAIEVIKRGWIRTLFPPVPARVPNPCLFRTPFYRNGLLDGGTTAEGIPYFVKWNSLTAKRSTIIVTKNGSASAKDLKFFKRYVPR